MRAHITLRQQKQIRDRALVDEAYVIEQLEVLAANVHHAKLPRGITAKTTFPERIAYIKNNGVSLEVVRETTLAYTVLTFWLENHAALFQAMYSKVESMIHPSDEEKTKELIRTMAISCMLNYTQEKEVPLFKYMSWCLWLKCRSMFSEMKGYKEQMCNFSYETYLAVQNTPYE